MTRAQMTFIDDMGQLIPGWGIPRNTGRIYAYLLLQRELATLDDIAADLGIAKSGAPRLPNAPPPIPASPGAAPASRRDNWRSWAWRGRSASPAVGGSSTRRSTASSRSSRRAPRR